MNAESEIYLEILRKGITPFDRFVSRGDIKDHVDIPTPRGDLNDRVLDAVEHIATDSVSLSIPILGVAGSGKTHAYWALKDLEKSLPDPNWTIIYIPSPPTAIRILFHVYTCIADDFPGFIDIVSRNLIDRFSDSADDDLDDVVRKATAAYDPEFGDCIKMLVAYGLIKEKRKRMLARRWIFGEAIDEHEFEDLDIHSVIEEDETGLAMIKLITEYMLMPGNSIDNPKRHKIIVLFFDEFESPFRINGTEAEAKFIDTLNRIFREVDYFLLIAAVLKDVWEQIVGLFDDPFKSRMQATAELQPFSFDDVKNLVTKSQEKFWNENHVKPPEDIFFPLNEEILKHIFERTLGNPRETIKLTRVLMEKIVAGELTIDQIMGEGTERANEVQAGTEEETTKHLDHIIDREKIMFDVTPSNVIYAFLKGLQEIAMVHHSEDETPQLALDFKFLSVDNREKTVGAVVDTTKEKIAVDIPAAKSFDHSAGVAAYYCAKRLEEGMKASQFQRAAMIIPESTGGEKLQYILESNPELAVFRITQEQADLLVKTALDPDLALSEIVYLFSNMVMKWADLPDEKS
ncbi:MAG TPA: hypothetical protein VKM55_16250 [Candidatus Lokiarchaeia archaeon]|nr:hypothetical protein [Candidatus Lokiarchaeia archaeon]